MLEQELDIENIEHYYFTDSEIILGCSNNEARRFHVYVGNRVQHIRDRSRLSQWHHVPGKENPADEASRGISAKELLENERWLNGPEFLHNKDPTACLKKTFPTQLDPTDIEVRKVTSTMTTSTGPYYPAMLEPHASTTSPASLVSSKQSFVSRE